MACEDEGLPAWCNRATSRAHGSSAGLMVLPHMRMHG